MAREVVITDDLDGSHGAQPVRFGLEDKQYEIDLSEQNIEALKEALAPYLEHGREVVSAPPAGRRRGRPRGAEPSARREDLAAIRAWAQAKGKTVAPAAASRPRSLRSMTGSKLASREGLSVLRPRQEV